MISTPFFYFSCTFMLMQKNANIDVMAKEEKKDEGKDPSQIEKEENDKKEIWVWEPVKKQEEEQKQKSIFQVL